MGSMGPPLAAIRRYLEMVSRQARPLWAMGRPYFLAGTPPLYLLGVAAAWREGYHIRASTVVLGLSIVWLIQLATHYNNEYSDLETDMATRGPTRISGGSRVLVRGEVRRGVARMAAVTTLTMAVALTIFLAVFVGSGWLTLGFVGVASLLGWFYSSPPLKLMCRGLGEVTIAFTTCMLLPAMAYHLESSSVNGPLTLACIPLALLTLGVTLATEVPDLVSDKATGKRTLVVRLGLKRAIWVQAGLSVAGWFALALVLGHLWEPWGWVVAVGSVPLLVMTLASLVTSGIGDRFAMERAGLSNTIMVGYGALALIAAFVMG